MSFYDHFTPCQLSVVASPQSDIRNLYYFPYCGEKSKQPNLISERSYPSEPQSPQSPLKRQESGFTLGSRVLSGTTLGGLSSRTNTFQTNTTHSSANPRRLGLSQVFEPESDVDPLTHVIFVHGLFGNPTKTWTKVSPRDRKKQTKNVFWPADLLPKVLPEARIWTWGYDADVHKFGAQSSHNTIEEHASNLLADLAGLIRRSPNNMPIIFVVHSLGGIVVKEAINQSSQSKETRMQDIAARVHGICFLGTPHHGSKSASIGRIAYQATVAVTGRANLSLLRSLKQNSDVLKRIGSVFMNTRLQHEIRTYSFHEEHKTTKFGFIGTMIVPSSSARMGLEDEDVGSIPHNHRDMGKFLHEEEVGFERVSNVLRSWVDLLLERTPASDKAFHDCLNSVNEEAARARVRDVAESHASTFHWLFDSTLVPFSEWLGETQKNSIFWIQGKPGSGKSTLMKFAMKHPTTLKLLRIHDSASWIIAGFFFHDRGTEIQKSLSGMLQELLYQVLSQMKFLLPAVHHIYSELAEKQKTITPCWSVPALRKALTTIFEQRRYPIRVCMFLDALDEHSGNNGELASTLRDFASKADGDRVRLKICVASRSWPTFEASLAGCPTMHIHQHTQRDIHLYILDQLQYCIIDGSRESIIEDNDLYTLVAMVSAKACGVFIWVRLMVQELLQAMTDGLSTFEELKALVSSMPAELKDLYKHTLLRIRPAYAHETHVMLQIALCSLTLLPLRTFINTTTLAVGRTLPEKPLEISSMLRMLNSRSGGLLEVVDRSKELLSRQTWGDKSTHQRRQDLSMYSHCEDDDENLVVQFIHQTAKDYVNEYGRTFKSTTIRQPSHSGNFYLLKIAASVDADWAYQLTTNVWEYASLADHDTSAAVVGAALLPLINWSDIELERLSSTTDLDDSARQYGRRLRIFDGLDGEKSAYYERLFKQRQTPLHIRLQLLAIAAGMRNYAYSLFSKRIPSWYDPCHQNDALHIAILGPRISSSSTTRATMIMTIRHKHTTAPAPDDLLGKITQTELMIGDPISGLDTGSTRYLLPPCNALQLALYFGRAFNIPDHERLQIVKTLLEDGTDVRTPYVYKSLSNDDAAFRQDGIYGDLLPFLDNGHAELWPVQWCIRHENHAMLKALRSHGATIPQTMIRDARAFWNIISPSRRSAMLHELIDMTKDNMDMYGSEVSDMKLVEASIGVTAASLIGSTCDTITGEKKHIEAFVKRILGLASTAVGREGPAFAVPSHL